MRSRKTVLIGLAAISLVIFVVGMGAAWRVRNKPICKDGRAPVAEQSGPISPTLYKCHNGQVVTSDQT